MTSLPKTRTRIQIQRVWPMLDCGRYPVKRTARRRGRRLGRRLQRRARRPARGRPLPPARRAALGRGADGADRQRPLARDLPGRRRSAAGSTRSRPGSTAGPPGAGSSTASSRAGRRTSPASCSRALRCAGVESLTLEDALDPALAPKLGREGETTALPLEVIVDRERARFGSWYELFPRSWGGFAGVEAAVARLAELGFDVVYLPPIHPIGRTHRKGRNNAWTPRPDDPGSPWAIGGPEGGHTAVNPELGTLADFDRLVAARAGARHRDRARLRDPVLARPPLARRASGVVPPPPGRDAQVRREPAQALPGHLQRQLRVRRLGEPLARRSAMSSSSGSATASGPSASTTRTRSRSPSGSG